MIAPKLLSLLEIIINQNHNNVNDKRSERFSDRLSSIVQSDYKRGFYVG